jgi:hypothetical protein
MHEENHISKLNHENTTSMIRENNVIETPYRHPNHKSEYLKQSLVHLNQSFNLPSRATLTQLADFSLEIMRNEASLVICNPSLFSHSTWALRFSPQDLDLTVGT